MPKDILITGGAGFIGSNYALRRIKNGDKVTIFDNLSRDGACANLDWITNLTGEGAYKFVEGDVRDFSALRDVIPGREVIVHLAAQVAVTTSVTDPELDFTINARGTFNVMEAVRQVGEKPLVIYASTNKVYGEMEDVEVMEKPTRYTYRDLPDGVAENQPLDFHSPYGCSKGCGDQYVRDYSRMYGIPSVVFRQSCIYGIRQFGIEDQGWLAWFVIAAVLGKPITIYGDGKQIRDVLYIDDLLDVYDLAIEKNRQANGWIFNIGGGPDNAISIWKEFGPMLEKLIRKEIPIRSDDWRPGDQKVYISDIRKSRKMLGWEPKVPVEEGIEKLFTWINQNLDLFRG